ncbi:MAG: class F sortase [Candidatus Paceibacterota bacterium]
MTRTKSITIVVVIIALIGAGCFFFFSRDKAGNTAAANTFGWEFPIVKFPITGPGDLSYSDTRDPVGIPQGLPIRLRIPVIGVDSAIEDAFITPDGRMDVPDGSVNVSWFALGPHPGQVGSAVIGGHFGIKNGVKFVFYDIDKLKVGDKVYILDDKGETLAFQVRSSRLFGKNADATTVFTSDDGLAHLNLVTCEGVWNQVNGSYPERRVVFTDAVAL